ncbi:MULTISPECIES: 5-formyltetrahydrofolate cyclo-ligase [Pelosinus]|uniref:5-formyltetrahydrofolate cyclo-ligase n=1 Tax=Pelosinus fermentans B4 TaxID=1149862 RepID=I8RJL3_9FIRM|nr:MULTISPECIES: 5-formyltetrahydrofolate cyclo-ligase [Pelosinus]EIW18390.1 5-formyltetrahydrofolate cyclo-ligase [Pelosinus fermentans B4]EIW24403.1 5-formyltetrahydrofolate cyclo-ligase [Pelosinus fermentans A11]OAM94538.1 5-formyltetrahydrofolate cyclo-ligase [Pelosinus fermentans DSM 17108]SDR11675.1 5-formyltetrahydrofolate cyclo-ligase [Pelosinus fermentans]
MKHNSHNKTNLRTELLLRRRTLDKDMIAAQSDNMAKHLFAWPYYQQAKVIMSFLSMFDEPQMVKIIEGSWSQGKTVCVPHMRKEFGVMDAAVIDNWNTLVKGRFNLLVPDPENLTIMNPELIDLIIVPGVGFDRSGNRLGMGAGYYDRFIPQAPQAILIGAIWSSHIIESIPHKDYDMPVHFLLNEDEIIKCDTING